MLKVIKRDNSVVDFDQTKIANAITKALDYTKEYPLFIVKDIVHDVVKKIREKGVDTIHVEEIQDIVEFTLMDYGLKKTAKAYIIYRERRRQNREISKTIDISLDLIDQYIQQNDWRVNENSNMTYSLQGLNHHISSTIIAKYWLERIYPEKVSRAHIEGDYHIHDLGSLSTYCCGWDLYDLLVRGFGGVPTKIESKPPKHFRTALGQIVNFLYTLQGESAGAQAFSNFDTLLAPFVRFDRLTYDEVKQCMQEFIFNLNIPTRVGFQTPFTNLTFDLKPTKAYANESVVYGGKIIDYTYSEFHEEMCMINRAFCEIMMQGDAKGRVFTFPIPTYNITKDFDWDNPEYELLWEMTRKYGIPYFANFVNSDMDPDDARSMCCRLRLDNREIRRRGGGLFGANPLTGSLGVVTINLPRLGYLSKTEEELFERLENLMELAKMSLEIKRKVLEHYTEIGLYPYSKHYLSGIKKRTGSYWSNHFSTIGIVGMNELCLNFIGEPIYTSSGKELAIKILKFMRQKLSEFQDETGHLYNLEATPAESTSFRLARIDKRMYPDIITQGTDEIPYYTNSVHLPVGYTDDIFEILSHQDDLQVLFTGGTVVHLFIGEYITSNRVVKELIKQIMTAFHLPYVSITPTFSICPVHGYIPGEWHYCPYPHTTEELQQYGVETMLPESILSKLDSRAYIQK